ncbi:hypothetical protein BDE02_03G107300 [Populus trichocarpa]|nr:hypothetical protein BDE02_03G107300 [Populus trichocarpa]
MRVLTCVHGKRCISDWKPIKVSSQSELVKPLLAAEVCFSTLSLSAQSWSKGNWEVLVNKKQIRHKNF